MSDTLGRPNANEAFVLNGNPAPRWFEWFSRLDTVMAAVRTSLSSISGDVGALPTFGTAATKDVGTSGSKIGMLDTYNQWGKAQKFTLVTLTDAATIEWDWSLGPIATVTLGGNRTLNTPTNMGVGTWALRVIQDGTGSRTLSTPFLYAGGTDPVFSTTAGAVDLLTCISDGTTVYAAVAKAFA